MILVNIQDTNSNISATKPLGAEDQFSFHTHKNINLKLYKQPLGLDNLSVYTTDSGDKNTGQS